MRFFRENLSYKILAIVLSVALWANVKLHQEPVTTAMTLPLTVRSVPENLVAIPSVSQITVVMYGPKVYLSRLDASRLQAFVNLANTSAGHLKQEVFVEMPPNLKPFVTITSISPDRIDVRLFQRRRRTVPVRVEWLGEPLLGARYGTVRVEPRTVDVAGADPAVEAVDHAEVSLRAGDPLISGRHAVTPVDAQGNPVSDVRVWPDAVTVYATITPTPRQQVLVSPRYTGNPAAGYEVDSIWSNPQVLTVLGPSEVIGSLKSIPTRPIDLTGEKDLLIRRVPVQVPRGVTAIPDTVQVRIQMRPVAKGSPGAGGAAAPRPS